jgi:hypothetical protein
MSDLTKLVRSIPLGGAVLDAIEGVEHDAIQPEIKQVEQVAITDIGQLLNASATVVLSKLLGPGATVAEPLVASFITDFENFLAGAITPHTPSAPVAATAS